jgi:hypothetical protein
MRIVTNQPFVLAGAEPMYEENAWKYLHNTVGLRTAFDIGARDSTLPHVFPTVALFEPNEPVEATTTPVAAAATPQKSFLHPCRPYP